MWQGGGSFSCPELPSSTPELGRLQLPLRDVVLGRARRRVDGAALGVAGRAVTRAVRPVLALQLVGVALLDHELDQFVEAGDVPRCRRLVVCHDRSFLSDGEPPLTDGW